MNKSIVSALLLLLSLSSSAQQTRYIHPSTLQLFFSISDFKSNSPSAKLSKGYGGLGLNFTTGISAKFDWSVAANFLYGDSVMKRKASLPSKELFAALDLSVRWRLLRSSALFQPFVNTGAGFSAIDTRFGPYLLAGTGLQVNLSQEIFPVIQIQRRIGLNNNIANHYFYSIGLAGNIGKRVKKTKPQTTVAIVEPRITDRDRDGTPDSLDICPDVPGVREYNGCPDTDKDGIADNLDKCPTVPGFAKYNGCPVPDTDKDGVNDEEDSCIDQPGLRELKGCPPAKREIKKAMDLAARNIFFKTGSYQLLPQSFPALDTVISILKDNPALKLSVEGHTDDVGKGAANKLLSENRAKSIVAYLVEGGIAATRLLSVGYGEERPIANNNSAAGRAANRRVELVIVNN